MTEPSMKYRNIQVKTVAGPSSYAAGGFTVIMDKLRKITAAFVLVSPNLEANNLVMVPRVTWSGNTITIIIRQIDVTGTSPVAWAEAASGTNFSGYNFIVLAVEE